MKNGRYMLPALLIILLAGCADTPSAPATPAPEGLTQTGSWVVREDQVMRLATGAEGKGTLIFQGWEYPFKFSGAKISVTGAEGGDIVGEVFNLHTLSDIEGTYFPKAEFDEANRVTGVWAHNDKGVTLHMNIQGENMGIIVGAKGATVTLMR